MYNTKETHTMETIVELYFDKELSDITFEADKLEEWKQINEELGLTNQLSLATGTDSPVPFPYMNESMQRVYRTMCPAAVRLQQYDKTPIPLEVLQQIAFTKKENHFGAIEVWYDDKSPDPLVVGLIAKFYFYPEKGDSIICASEEECKAHPEYKNKQTIYEQSPSYYLIARWGDVKRTFQELKEMAKARFIEIHGAQMKTDIETLKQKLANLEQGATLYLAGEISQSKATTTQDW